MSNWPNTITIHTDGGARGNPGPAAIGLVISHDQRQIATVAETIGSTTNNQAEYRAIIRALELAVDHGVKDLAVVSDSQLVICQINGEYRVKHDDLKPLADSVRALCVKIKTVRFSHIKRLGNTAADRLVNQALDGHPHNRGL